jgi:maltose-binding protein MalE
MAVTIVVVGAIITTATVSKERTTSTRSRHISKQHERFFPLDRGRQAKNKTKLRLVSNSREQKERKKESELATQIHQKNNNTLRSSPKARGTPQQHTQREST